MKAGNRLAELEFSGFVDEYFDSTLKSLGKEATVEDVSAQLLTFIKYAGQKLRVLMPGGRREAIYRAFDVNDLSKTPKRKDEGPVHERDRNLPRYSFTDYYYLDELACSLRLKADDLGLSWKNALSIIENYGTKQTLGPSATKRPEVAARRAVLLGLMGKGDRRPSAKVCCKRFDFAGIACPETWTEKGVQSWCDGLKRFPELVAPRISSDLRAVKRKNM
jgi:hypothetical protein